MLLVLLALLDGHLVRLQVGKALKALHCLLGQVAWVCVGVCVRVEGVTPACHHCINVLPPQNTQKIEPPPPHAP